MSDSESEELRELKKQRDEEKARQQKLKIALQNAEKELENLKSLAMSLKNGKIKDNLN